MSENGTGTALTPADVQAAPDPRLDVVAFAACGACGHPVTTHRSGGCLATVADSETCFCVARYGVVGDWADPEPALGLAGLTPQEIRLRIFEAITGKSNLTVDEWATWVEHGPDETPALRYEQRALRIAAGRDAAIARADLAEARLGHIADALRDYPETAYQSDGFARAVEAALAWTPDDTAPTEEDFDRAARQSQADLRAVGITPPPYRDDTATADAATGDE